MPSSASGFLSAGRLPGRALAGAHTPRFVVGAGTNHLAGPCPAGAAVPLVPRSRQ